MKWYLYLALKQLFPSSRGYTFFSIISILGVALGVMVLVIVQSVMNGFSHGIEQKIVDINGHIKIQSAEILYDISAIETVLRSMSEVQSYAPYAEGLVMLQHLNRPAFPYIKGIEFSKESKVLPINSFLISGSWGTLDTDSIILSTGLANSLGATLHSVIDLYSPLMLERMKDSEVLLPREVTVGGILQTGWNQVDANTVICDISLMQELYGLGDGIHGFSVRLKEGVDAPATACKINRQIFPEACARSWQELDKDLLFVLRLEKTTMFFIVIFIIVVASFSITSSLMTAVVRKTKEIGLLGALGSTPRQIAAIFCIQGVIIGALGSILGIVGALGALYVRNDFIAWVTRLTQSQDALTRYYPFTHVPVHYFKSDFYIIIGFTMAIATLAALLPAWRAARIHPVECLRNE